MNATVKQCERALDLFTRSGKDRAWALSESELAMAAAHYLLKITGILRQSDQQAAEEETRDARDVRHTMLSGQAAMLMAYYLMMPNDAPKSMKVAHWMKAASEATAK